MFTSTQVKELEKLYNRYSCWLEAFKGEEERNTDRMIAFSRVMEILGYEVELEGETVSYELASYGVKYDTYRLVRKKDSQNSEVKDMTENIINLISALEDKRASIEDKVHKEDRDITEREQEKLDGINKSISNLDDCIWWIEYAMEYLEDDTDW